MERGGASCRQPAGAIRDLPNASGGAGTPPGLRRRQEESSRLRARPNGGEGSGLILFTSLLLPLPPSQPR